eukprot:tig00000241_g20942.t1
MASEAAMAFEGISREDPAALLSMTGAELQALGIAPVKREYLRVKPRQPKQVPAGDGAAASAGSEAAASASSAPEAPAGGGAANGEAPAEGGAGAGDDAEGKKRKGDRDQQGGGGKRKKRERIRAAPQDKPARDQKMCFTVALGEECAHGEKCHFSHDVAKYLASKPADLGPSCRHFEASGKCPFGILCRYGATHIRDGKNVVDEVKFAAWKDPLLNVFTRDLQTRLRKKQLSFARSDRFQAEWDAIMKERNRSGSGAGAGGTSGQAKELEGCEGEECAAGEEAPERAAAEEEGQHGGEEKEEEEDAAEPATQEASVKEPAAAAEERKKEELDQGSHDREARLRPAEKRRVDFAGKTYLAPLTTVGNTPFRRICRGLGCEITCGEMAMAPNLLAGQNSEWALLRRHRSEGVFGVQLCGSVPELLAKVAELIEDHIPDVDFVDLNCGCPIDIVVNRGGGSALLNRPQRFEGVVRSMSSILSCPVTVKMRTGWDDKRQVAHKFAPLVAQWGASAVTVHDWEYINRVAEGSPVPVIGNGDILGWEDYWARMESGKIATCMVARGALLKPWIFTEIKERRTWDISAGERLDLCRDFVNYGLDHWGSDDKGVENTRRFLLEWLSYTCRYIPAGLLEVLPQRINDRPPKFCARSDLEDLLCSDDSRDWVKISEMLLGPVPEGFRFMAKHKSASYGNG